MKYQIIIKNLETDEVVFSNEGDAIIGGLAYKYPESSGSVKGHAFAALDGPAVVALGAAEFAETAIKTLKKELMDDFIMGFADQIKEERDENN